MRYLLPFLLVAIAAVPAHAQKMGDAPPWPWKKERPGYVHFGFDPNVDALVKDRLKLEHDLGPFKDLVRDILANPDRFPIDPEKFKEMRLEDPSLKKAVQNWLAQDPDLKKAMENWIEQQPANKQPADMKQFQKNLKEIIDQASPPALKREPPFVKRWPPGFPPRKPDANPITKATERAMNEAQNSDFGEWLRDSPAWKQAFEDLRASMQNPDGSTWGMGDWQKRLGIDERKAWDFGAEALKRVQNMPRPDFERVNWNRALPGVGALPTPNFSAPGMPSYTGPSLPTVSTWVTWLLVLALTLLFGWQLMRWTRRTASAPDERAMLGPWPVLPHAISTRAELVQAFDYFALLTLGLRVTSWNHQAVARRWSEQSPALTSSAQTLAALYEASRYTEGVEELAPPERDRARKALAQLAEAL